MSAMNLARSFGEKRSKEGEGSVYAGESGLSDVQPTQSILTLFQPDLILKRGQKSDRNPWGLRSLLGSREPGARLWGGEALACPAWGAI